MPVQPGVAASLTTQAGKEARDLRDGGSTCPAHSSKGGRTAQSPTTTIPSTRAPTHPHLILAVATLRSPAAHPRLLGQRAFRLEVDEAGRAGPHSSFPPLPDEARIDIYWLCNQMWTYSIPTTYNPRRRPDWVGLFGHVTPRF